MMAYSPRGYVPPEAREIKGGSNCLFYLNGDSNASATKVVISNRTRLENVKDELTTKINKKDNFKSGVVRNIYTPINGSRVTKVEDFKNGGIYVAAVNHEKFVALNYQDIQPPKPNWKKGQFKKIDVDRIYTPVSHQHDPRLRNLEGRAREMGRRCTAVRLKIHMNGDYTSESIPITIKDAKSKSLVEIMNIIQDTLHSQQLSRLYKVVNDGGSLQNFHQLTENDIPQLENGDHIVALEKTPYKLAPKTYHKRNNFDTSASPRHNRSLTPPRRKQFSKHKPLPSIGSSNQSQNDTMSPFSNAPSHGGRKSNKSKGSRNQRDYDTDEGGVFKAKKQNNAQGAHQVNDSRETRTEKPIDQREAEVVDEEEIHSKEKTTPIPPGTELNKRPSKETKQNSDNGSQSKTKIEERVNEDADMHRIDEFADESFNHYEQNTSGPITGDPRSSTPASQGEARKKREQEEYQAAAKIQAGARAYKARKEYKAKKEAKRQDDDDRRRRQQEEEADRFEEERRKAEDNSKQKQLDEDKAATKIQASFKGHKARKDFKERQAAKQQVCHDKQSKNEKEIEAATKIQSGFRGYKARKDYNHRKKQAKITDINDNEKKADNKVGKTKMNQDDAAVVIQAGYKGYKTRKDFAQRKAQEKNEKIEAKVDNNTDNDKEQMNAATKIQANFRGYKARKDYSNRKQKAREDKARVEKESATKIQASFKGFKARKEIAEKKKNEPQLPDQSPSPKANDADLDKAASKIQAGFKGYKARKEYNAKGQQ